MKWVVVACIPFLVLIGCKTTEEALKETGKKPLTSAQLEKLYSGKTVVGTNSTTGRGYQTKYNTDGSAILSSGSFTDSGKWWVENNAICLQWAIIKNGAKHCLQIYALGDKYESINSDGYANSTFTVK